MTARTWLLWITDEVPDPNRGGGSIRQYQLLRRIVEEADVDLLVAGELPDGDLRGRLRQVHCIDRPEALGFGGHTAGKIDTLRRRMHNLSAFVPARAPTEVVINRRVVEALRRQLPDLSDYDTVQVEHEHLAGLLPGRQRGRWAITLHNLMSVRFRQRAEVEDKPRVRRLWEAEARRARRWEQRIVAGYDLTIVMSDEDARTLPGAAIVVPNGVDLIRFAPSTLPREPRLIFSGSFNYEPNVDGAVWLCEDILPRVRQLVPAATAAVVGRQPDQRVKRLAEIPGVETHFDVPDIFPHMQRARVALVPLRQGSGTRIKALEAMAAGRPLAGTPIGLAGLGLVNGSSAAIASTASDLADATARLLVEDDFASAIAVTARRLVERDFDWDRLAERYLQAVARDSLRP